MRLTQRLLIGSLLIVGVLVVLVVAILDGRLRYRFYEESAAELLREARLVAAQWRPGLDIDSLANAAGRALGHRVTLIDSTGKVVGDSEFDHPALDELENHLTRAEVTEAARSGSGSSRRVSASAGDEELYAAIRTQGGFARVSVSAASIQELFARARTDVLMAAAIALVLAFVLAWLFSRSVARPVVELRDVARALAAGDLARRPSLAAPGEVGDLASAVHRLAEQLSSRIEALEAEEIRLAALTESLNEGVIAIDARQQVVQLNERARSLLGLRDTVPFATSNLPRERGLREAIGTALSGRAVDAHEVQIGGRELALTARPLPAGGAVVALFDLTPVRRLETVRRDFVANASHELRTPLTVIGGFAETLLDDSLPNEQRRQFTGTVLANAQRMQRIVDDLLDLSRIESGGWKPNPTRADVRALAEEAIATTAQRRHAESVELRLEIAPNATHVWADSTALRQVLTNLVDNAVRHTNDGSVTVFTRRTAHGVAVGVSDTGIGIPGEHLGRIFERFYRVDAGRSRSEGGTGLGLAIVKHLIEGHGGRVRAESTVGRGTTIWAELPDAPTVPAP
ncbi:MAG TPA: ATP-binding protein [Gemmatimonadaceae bacterium]|nr:ATP-binding protein [Gemmatimonadaceae bacterium]